MWSLLVLPTENTLRCVVDSSGLKIDEVSELLVDPNAGRVLQEISQAELAKQQEAANTESRRLQFQAWEREATQMHRLVVAAKRQAVLLVRKRREMKAIAGSAPATPPCHPAPHRSPPKSSSIPSASIGLSAEPQPCPCQGVGFVDIELENYQCSSVFLAHEGNGWRHQLPMTRGPQGKWSIRLSHPSFQRLLFKFVVDGEWITSPRYSTHSENGFTNNVIIPAFFDFRDTCPTDRVEVAGEFSGWKSLKMDYCPHRQGHVVAVPLPHQGSFEFKYVVNGEWKTSSLYDTTVQSCYTNNVIRC